ncbi:MAG: class I SAM-dependent methyltransferase [Candidatus Micrarchaeia archaeon]
MASRALERMVSKELGVYSRKPILEAGNPAINELLRPNARDAFPLNRFHDYSRLPMEHWREWIDFDAITAELMKNKRISKLVEIEGSAALEKTLKEVMNWRAMTSYEEEWSNRTGAEIKKSVVEPSKGLPADANEENAKGAAKDLHDRIAERGNASLMDLGCGGGGTIIPVIAELYPEERRKLDVHLVDVTNAGLKETKRKLKAMGVRNVKTYKTNFYELAYRVIGAKTPPRLFNPLRLLSGVALGKKARALRGKLDVIVSGAALHHAADVEPIFKAVSEMTRKDGTVHLFDWGHSRTETQTINLNDPRLKEKVYPVANAPSHLDTIRAMSQTWLSLWGYAPEAKELLVKRLNQGGEFNFAEWLTENKARLEPLREKPKSRFRLLRKKEGYLPWCMEGHRNPAEYVRLLEKYGFKTETSYPLARPGTDHTGNMLYLMSAKKKSA